MLITRPHSLLIFYVYPVCWSVSLNPHITQRRLRLWHDEKWTSARGVNTFVRHCWLCVLTKRLQQRVRVSASSSWQGPHHPPAPTPPGPSPGRILWPLWTPWRSLWGRWGWRLWPSPLLGPPWVATVCLTQQRRRTPLLCSSYLGPCVLKERWRVNEEEWNSFICVICS